MVFTVDPAADTLRAKASMNIECKIEQSSTLRKFIKIAFGGENEHFPRVHVHFEILDKLHRTCFSGFKNITHVVHPGIQPALAFYSLILPMGGKTFLGNGIHTTCAYLNLHPTFLRTIYRDMQRFIAVALRNAKPVFKSRGVRAIHVGDYGISHPAFAFFTFRFYIKHNTDSE